MRALVEGITNNRVQFYGRQTGVAVARGQRATPSIPFAAAVPTVTTPALQNTTSYSQRIPFARIAAATSYAYQISKDPDFGASGLIERTAADSNPLVIVPDIPIASLGLLLGVDRFMSQCRAATNFIGNGIVTLAVARWENELNRRNLDARVMSNPEPEAVM